jgi:putative tryptophan/tyrosine transport system ATP-binding protein
MSIRLENIHLKFNPGTALENVIFTGLNLTIDPGQFITVIGSNGAGKSTLLNLLSGDLQPTTGNIWMGDRNVTALSVPQRAPLVSRVFQNPLAGSCPHLTLAENLALADRRGSNRGLKFALPRQKRQQWRERLVELGLGLENRLDDAIGLLSGGQRQAVSLLMASLAPSQILLLDEHTAALDPAAAAKVLELTTTLVQRENRTTLMVTHSMRQALDLGDRTIMLHSGEIILDTWGEARRALSIGDLLDRFTNLRNAADFAEDGLLLD